MRVTLFDPGVGNLHSLAKAIQWALPAAVVVESADAERAIGSDVLVLPGVGAFAHAAALLERDRPVLRKAISNGLPTIGICLGMQLLFDESEEGEGAGLGLIPGRVERLRTARVPHMGWSRVAACGDPGLPLDGAFYFAHSFVCRPANTECIVAETTIEGTRIPVAVRSGSMLGLQFHPEKSSRHGLLLLGAALKEVTR